MMRPRFLTIFSNKTDSPVDPAAQKASTYQYIIDWSPADQQFKAKCKKYPDISYLAGSREAALAGARQEVAAFLAG